MLTNPLRGLWSTISYKQYDSLPMVEYTAKSDQGCLRTGTRGVHMLACSHYIMASGTPCLRNCVRPGFSLGSFICHECRAVDGNLASHLLVDAVCNRVKDYTPPEASTYTLAPALARPRFIASGSTIFTSGPNTPNTVFPAEPKAVNLPPRTPLARYLDKHPATAAEVDAVNRLLKHKADRTTLAGLDSVQGPTSKKMRKTKHAGMSTTIPRLVGSVLAILSRSMLHDISLRLVRACPFVLLRLFFGVRL